MALLEYENQIFLDAFHEDGLLITARGLCVDRVFINFLKLYCDPANLVLVLQTSLSDEEYFLEELSALDVQNLPKQITNEYSANDRTSVYLEGGVLFVTSRILVMDLLTDKLPTHLVTGILVYKAHRIIESCQEAFILRLYRQKNKTGFIKAFSDQPQCFASGFCKLERVMKNLFVRKLYLWPRFHVDVKACMDKHKPEVIELGIPMTGSMKSIQSSILDIMNAVVKEIKQCNPSMDIDDLTVENSLAKQSLEQIIRLQLDPVWYQLGSKTKQLVSDLKLLRALLFYLTQYDCVTFYKFLQTLRSSETRLIHNSGWLFLESADSMFSHAKDRVYGSSKKTKNKKNDASTEVQDVSLEESPKWKTLSEILEEIETENKEDSAGLGIGRVMIVAHDDRTCCQLRDYLKDGAKPVLMDLCQRALHSEEHMAQKEPKRWEKGAMSRRKRKIEETEKDDHDVITLTQIVKRYESHDKSFEDENKKFDPQPSLSSESCFTVVSSSVTVIHPLQGHKDPFSFRKTLKELQPRYVILYDADIQLVRQLEVYKACRPGEPLRVYFLVYSGSTEEQQYLTSLRKESNAFEHLIKEKATLVIPEDINDMADIRSEVSSTSGVSSRKAGGQDKEPSKQKILVDLREFRSELPSLIHKRGIEIEPITLEVGDYILTPDMCVERKSLSDLIGSLNSGRLYNQCTSMSRYYAKPILLIEFDPNKSFALQPKTALGSEISIQNVSSKLTLLTLHFPKLRIFWCPSPHATAELFEEIKIGKEQPDSAVAMTITGDESEISDKYNYSTYDFVIKLPGINSKNYWMILNKVKNLTELIGLSQEELCKLLDNSNNGKALWEFLHHKHGVESKEGAAGVSKDTRYNKGKQKMKK
ncbi:DNA repair endonuclease XPF-like [Saccoglossus kowalevskii]|uniref:DNA repair endonuclease XPF-like n=1 Tax=Saccoglossus kowalevskii TaxID=10224 RepID=A0ABM0LY02_SACKO|nr:PREDICTED: DNA repair endonuclease XPF-like [Saccoglossus kowalevskii]